MRIGIDARWLSKPNPSGIGVYLIEILTRLNQADDENEYLPKLQYIKGNPIDKYFTFSSPFIITGYNMVGSNPLGSLLNSDGKYDTYLKDSDGNWRDLLSIGRIFPIVSHV